MTKSTPQLLAAARSLLKGGGPAALSLAADIDLFLRSSSTCTARTSGKLMHESNSPKESVHKLCVAVATVITCRGKVLLKQRISEDGNGKWALIGGKVEQGASIQETALSEAEQEVGLALDPARLVQVRYDEGITDYGMPFVILFNSIDLTEDEASVAFNREPDKCSAIGWFNQHQLPDLVRCSMWERDLKAIAMARPQSNVEYELR